MPELTKSIDFDPAAVYYDAFVNTATDVPFWVEAVAAHGGKALELMCGTGRISLPILRAGHQLTCVDYSAGQLAVLQRKLDTEGLAARVVHADVRRLELAKHHRFAFIGFHAFAELLTDADALAALTSIRACLAPGGVLFCSLHNPAVRRRSVTGAWQEFGPFPLPEGRQLVVRARFAARPASQLVEGAQVYAETTAGGQRVGGLELPVRFRLYERADFERLAAAAGWSCELRYGAYDGTPFSPESPAMIFALSP